MKVKTLRQRLYQVKRGQTATQIAQAFCLPLSRLIADNALKGEVREGQVLKIPDEEHNLYVVQGGESKTLLCGSEERYFALNGTQFLYVGQKIWI